LSKSFQCGGAGVRDALKRVHHLVQRRARVDLNRRTCAQQRLNLRQVGEDPIPLGIALAERVRLSTSHALEDHVRGSRQQHNGVEARIELSLVRNTA
jgi:hypothetical protein